MRKAWIGVALLSASWLVGLRYYHQADMIAWAVLVGLGTAFMAGAFAGRPGGAAAIIGAVFILPAAWMLGWPWRIGPALLAAGLLVVGLPVAREWLRRVGAPLLAAGLVLSAQSLAIFAYAALTARCHELPAALAKVVAYVAGLLHTGTDGPLALAARLLGSNIPLVGNNLAVQAGGAVHNIGATWELLLDPVTGCFLAGAAAIIVLRSWQAAADRRGLWPGCGMFVRLAVATALWLPLRAALMIGIYCHRAMPAVSGGAANLTDQFLSPWLCLAMLAGPVLLAWRVGRTSSPAEPISTRAPGGKHERRIGGPAVVGTIAALLAGAAITAAVVWDPAGRAKPGRILWDEYHSQQPWPGKDFDFTATDRPLDTEWYGPAAVRNWSRISDYVSRFYRTSLIKTPLAEEHLRDVDVLVLKAPSKAYTPQEIAAVERFVRRGGGVLMVGEHTNAFGSAEILNALAARFGFGIQYDTALPIDPPGAPFGTAGAEAEIDGWQPLAAHPIMQYVGPVSLVGGATIRFDEGRAVILRGGLKSLPADYSARGYRPADANRPDMRYGAFAQIWAHKHGAGRVAAIADASSFTNLAAFEPRRRELMLGLLDWLNRENRMPDPRWVLVLVGACLALLALATTRPMHKAWPLAVGAAALGWAGTIVAVPIWNRAEMPPPKPTLPMVQIAIDSRLSDIRLPHAGRLAGGRDGFGQFELSILRLGYFPRRAVEAGLLGDAFTGEPNAIVVIRPSGEVTGKYRRMMEAYVESGGTLLVMDSPDNKKSAANRLLEPFGLKFSMDRQPVSGITVGGDLPSLRISQAWAVEGPAPLVSLAIPTEPGAATKPVPAIVASVARKGRGAVVAVGFASRFSDAEMGASPDIVPNAQQRKVFDFEFALLRQIVEARLPAPAGPAPAPPTAPATAPAPAPAAPAGPGNVATGGATPSDVAEPVDIVSLISPPRQGRRSASFAPAGASGKGERIASTGFAALHPWLQSFAPTGRIGLWLLNADKTTPMPSAFAEAAAGRLLKRLPKP